MTQLALLAPQLSGAILKGQMLGPQQFQHQALRVGGLHRCRGLAKAARSVTGNGRRESFAHVVLPRMTNTYMRAGSRTPEEIIASVERGIYAVNFEIGRAHV